MTKKRKIANKSNKVHDGTLLRTRDLYLPGGESSPHEKEHRNVRILYRKVLVIDSNRNDELAILELTSNPKGKVLSPKTGDRSRARPFAHRTFANGEPLKIKGEELEHYKEDLPYSETIAQTMRDYSLHSPSVPERIRKDNERKIRILKRRVYSKKGNKK